MNKKHISLRSLTCISGWHFKTWYSQVEPHRSEPIPIKVGGHLCTKLPFLDKLFARLQVAKSRRELTISALFPFTSTPLMPWPQSGTELLPGSPRNPFKGCGVRELAPLAILAELLASDRTDR